MSPKFKVGEIVIIQNQVGEDSVYNGVEVSILAIPDFKFDGQHIYEIDLLHPRGKNYHALESQLRRRDNPAFTGEQRIFALFLKPLVDCRRSATAQLAQYHTAHALMPMGVRVKPGKWPVEAV